MVDKIKLEILEVDSITNNETECLFYWLWKKEDIPFPRKYNFYIPDTVIYKYYYIYVYIYIEGTKYINGFSHQKMGSSCERGDLN